MRTSVSATHETKTAANYAGIDCCCNAGSIAISNEAPLSSDIDIGREFGSRTVRGWLGGWLGGRFFCLHRHRTRRQRGGGGLWLEVTILSPGVPTTGHFGDFRRSSPAARARASENDVRSSSPTAGLRRHEGTRG